MRLLNFCLIVILLTIFFRPTRLSSQQIIPDSEKVLILNDTSFQKNDSYNKWTVIETGFKYYEDSSNALLINDVIKPDIQEKLIYYKEEKPQANKTYWFKLNMIKKGNRKKLLLVTSKEWDLAELYIYKNNSEYELQITGKDRKRPAYGFDHFNYFLIDLQENKISTLYFKLLFFDRDPAKIEFKLNDFNLYKEGLAKYKLFYLSFLSVLSVMIICIGFIYILVKKRVFFMYMIMLTAFLGAFSIFFFYNVFNKYIHFLIVEQFCYSLAVSFFVLFTLSYFSTNKKSKKLNRISIYSVISFSAIFITHVLLVLFSKNYPFYSQNIFMFAIVIMMVLAYIITINAIKHKFKLAWFFLLSISFTCLSGVYLILTVSKVLNLSSQMEAKKIFLISLIFLVAFFSMSIGYLIFKLTEKRAKIMKENLEIQKNINIKLEIKVAERTEEIVNKNEILEKQKEEIMTQNEEILLQRDELLKHQKEIFDSINYAKRIQSAILPPDEIIKEILPQHFILYKPRDIVSGDFYWVKHINNYILFAAIDCTGHGVPGAFMSMLGTAFMNEIARRQEITKPNQFLNILRDQVKSSLRQTGKHDEAKDGMDLALCVINNENNTMQYSGANNPLFLIRNKELIQIKADRMPVGIHEIREDSFTNHEIKLQNNDMIYIFSDGFKDQIGGPKNKKFMAWQFREILMEIHLEDMQNQKEILDRTIETWKNFPNETEEVHGQVDDILIMGVKI